MTPLAMKRPVKCLVNLFLTVAAPGATIARGGHGAAGKRLRARFQS